MPPLSAPLLHCSRMLVWGCMLVHNKWMMVVPAQAEPCTAATLAETRGGVCENTT
jgi:hypothetical protein